MVLFGLIKCLSVFHQSRGPVSAFLCFAASLSITDCFALWVSAVVMFRISLEISNQRVFLFSCIFCINTFFFLYFFYFTC